MKIILIVLLVILTIIQVCADRVSVKWYRWYDQQMFFVDLIGAQSPFGESVKSMVKRTNGIAGINLNFFDRNPTANGIMRSPVGEIFYRMDNITVCSIKPSRCYIWQDTRAQIGYKPPARTIFATQIGPALIINGKLFPGYPEGFTKEFWNKKCLRTIVATEDNQFRLYKIWGNLWDIGKYLKTQGIKNAANADGDSSSWDIAPVSNALVVFRKSRPVYQDFSAKYFLSPIPYSRQTQPSLLNSPGL